MLVLLLDGHAVGCRATGLGGSKAETGWHEGFEASEASGAMRAGTSVSCSAASAVQGNAHGGNGCEWIRVEGESGGTHVYFAHDVGARVVINDLEASVWVKSDRPGLQLMAQVVLPRAVDPRTGQPMAARSAASVYGRGPMAAVADQRHAAVVDSAGSCLADAVWAARSTAARRMSMRCC